jgi:hypothetical protein
MTALEALHKASQYNAPGVVMGTKPPGSLCCFINTDNPGFIILTKIANWAQKQFRKAQGKTESRLAKTALAALCYYQKQPRRQSLSDCLEKNHRSRMTDVTRTTARLIAFSQKLNDGTADVDTIVLDGKEGLVLCKEQKSGTSNGTSLAMKFTAKLVMNMTHYISYPTLHELADGHTKEVATTKFVEVWEAMDERNGLIKALLGETALHDLADPTIIRLYMLFLYSAAAPTHALAFFNQLGIMDDEAANNSIGA